MEKFITTIAPFVFSGVVSFLIIKNRKTVSKSIIALGTIILFRAVLKIINRELSLYLMIFDVHQWVMILISNLLIGAIIVKLILNIINKRILKYIVCFFASIIMVGQLFLTSLFECDRKYFNFISPDNTRSIIVEEDSFLLGGWSNFYEKKGFVFIKSLGQIRTDDGYRPFSNNDYDIRWIDNKTLHIKYGFGSNSIYKNEVIKLH